ncbi:MAG TPA: HAD-IC family P-type ATPase [Candidatus Limiplasma sp.]|nr:HAD-IC family P-type ATPase [Candidatus Limiplasma sp.]
MNRTLKTDRTASAVREECPDGLSTAQAKALAARGQGNQMPHSGDGGVFSIVRRNLFTLYNLLNIVLAALLVWVGSYRNLLFMGVVVSNAVIGLVQELRAKRMHDRLLLLSEGKVRTLRDGAEAQIAPGDLVLGDVIRLRRGDQAPADARVLAGQAEVNESLLTGESEPIAKAAGDALLSGSYLTEGELTATLTAVGAQSFAGQLQTAARRVRRPRSELMASLNRLIRGVSVLIVPVGVALYLRQTLGLGLTVEAAVTKTVAATLGMIPEGLILLTSVALAVGVVRLGRQGALVNELYGIENLARVDVLCLDKTGTLTSGQMSVTEMLPLNGHAKAGVEQAMRAFTAVFANEESPTQQALAVAFPPQTGVDARATVPFSSERKWSAAEIPGHGTLVLGAPEKTLFEFPKTLALAQTHAAKGFRVLALLRGDQPITGRTLPEGLIPLALILVGDTVRPKVRDTLRYFDTQGVAIKVISGDSALTVARIAEQAGLAGAERAVDCSTVPQPPDYDALAREYTVFGRVSPEDKRGLIGALKRQGHTVGMIGDGVNDVPALKTADCSIAVAGGSDAASRVAQITLLSADFGVMPDIVAEGRRVINNITRASALFLVKNIFSFVLAAFLLVLPFAYPFVPIQLTLVSSLSIGLPSFVLALQPNRERVRGRFLPNVLRRAIPGGITVSAVCLLVMAAGGSLGLSGREVSTLCTLVAAVSGH